MQSSTIDIASFIDCSASYLLQGNDESKTMLDALNWVLDLSNLDRCIITSAYIDSGGVSLIINMLNKIRTKVIVYCGIDNGVTTYEAICQLVDSGIKVIGIDTANARTIFHQKAYASSSPECGRMLITSANLTERGLLRNYEGGLTIKTFNEQSYSLLNSLEEELNTLQNKYPNNFIQYNTIDDIDADKSLFITSKERSKIIKDSYEKHNEHTRSAMGVASKRKQSKSPRKDSDTDTSNEISNSPDNDDILNDIANNIDNIQLIWTATITKRHLNISNKTTHGTGDFNLGKGKKGGLVYDEGYDFQLYYRYDLFADYDWNKSDNGIECAQISFHIYFDNVYKGEFFLTVTYTRADITVEQKNATTAIKWGNELSHLVKNTNYIGGNISLLRSYDTNNETIFTIMLCKPSQ